MNSKNFDNRNPPPTPIDLDSLITTSTPPVETKIGYSEYFIKKNKNIFLIILGIIIISILILILIIIFNNKKNHNLPNNNSICEIGKEDKCKTCGLKENECGSCNYRYILEDGKCIANFTFWAKYSHNLYDTTLIENIPLFAQITKMIIMGKEVDFTKKYTNYDFLTDYDFKVYFLMDVSNCTSLDKMFYRSRDIESIYFTKNFKTGNVKSMREMFSSTFDLKSVDISN